MKPAARLLSLLTEFGRTGAGERISPFEVLRLRFGIGKLGLSDLHDYDIRQAGPKSENDAFCGWRTEKSLDEAMNTRNWRGIFDDKLNTYTCFLALGVPFPRVLAVLNDSERSFPGARLLRNERDVADFLALTPPPLFAKPVHGSFGAGSMHIGHRESSSGRIWINHSESLSETELYERLHTELRRGGYLFQQKVTPHPAVAPFCSEAVSTIRMVVLLSAEPVLHRVVWKLPAAGAVTDHFREGAGGSLICAVDVDSGTVLRAVGRAGDGRLREVDQHPITRMPLKGALIPQFAECRALVRTHAPAFPGLRFQHWDVAITEQGPMVLEINTEGGVRIPQMAYGKGLLDDEMRQAIELAKNYQFG
jgi:hypothetical protein